MDDLVAWLAACVDEDEAAAKAASGGTVVGEPRNWRAAPGGDEWEVSESDAGDVELLVALRPGQPRPADVMGGYWGAVVSWHPDYSHRGESSPLPCFQHAALHDPARVLREAEADRQLLAEYKEAAKEHADDDGRNEWNEGFGAGELAVLRRMIRRRAATYSDHPGYDPAWAPAGRT